MRRAGLEVGQVRSCNGRLCASSDLWAGVRRGQDFLGPSELCVEHGVVDGLEAGLFGAHAGDAGEEGFCIGVLRIAQDFIDGAGFDDLATEHDGDAVHDAADDAEIVGDEDDGHVEIPAELGEEVHDLLLDGDVEGGGGLVGDEELGLGAEGHGDHDALLHAAAELVRVGVETLAGIDDAHFVEPLDDFVIASGFGDIGAMQGEGFANLGADGEDGIEGGGGLLEDVGDFFAADGAQLALVHLEDFVAIERHLACGDAGGRLWEEAGEGEGGGAFAAAAFTDEGDGFAALELEADAFDGFHGLGVMAAEGDLEIADAEQRGIFGRSGFGGHGLRRVGVVRCG